MAIGQDSAGGLGTSGIMQRSIQAWQQKRIADAQEEANRQKEQQAKAQQQSQEQKKPGNNAQKSPSTPEAETGKGIVDLIKPNVGLGSEPSRGAGGAMPKGGAGSISPSELYSYLINRGATRNQAIMLTGAAGAESTWHPNLSHDKGTGYGLWGHRAERWDAMANMAGDRHPSWQKQADYALWELNNSKDGGIRRANAELARATNPEQIAIAQMHFERPVGYRPDSPQSGHNFSGRLALVRQIDSGSFGGRSTTPATSSPATPVQDAGSRRAQYAQAGDGTRTDATLQPSAPTTPTTATPGATTPQAQPAATTPGSQPPTAGQVSPAPAVPLPPQRPADLAPAAPLPPQRPSDLATPPPGPQPQPDAGKGIGGFFDGLFGAGEPIKDQYGRTWDGFEGWVDPKAKAETAKPEEARAEEKGILDGLFGGADSGADLSTGEMGIFSNLAKLFS